VTQVNLDMVLLDLLVKKVSLVFLENLADKVHLVLKD